MNIKKGFNLFGGYFFRWIGFPTEPCLVKIGNPDRSSPVFLTCNFSITVKRVMKALKGLDCYLLIAPSRGINVWCGACGDDFNTDSVISIIKTSRIGEMVDHRILILPQLSAPGIDPKIIKKEVGWNVKYGPVYAKDIKEYVRNEYSKSEKMRMVKFPISKRFEMANMYFFTICILFSAIYWIVALFLPILRLMLYINSFVIIAIILYGSLTILPSLKTKTGRPKALLFEIVVLFFIIVFYGFIFQNIFYLIWSIILSLLIDLILIEDFNGLTPTYKSELGEKSWKKGKDEMSFMTMKIKLQPYGDIKIERDKCIGCMVCIEVCPRNLYRFNEQDKKVDLYLVENCINCNACVKRCLVQCLEII